MRTRIREGDHFGPVLLKEYQWDQSNPLHYKRGSTQTYRPPFHWTVPTLAPSFREVMTDDIGTDGRFRPCLHQYDGNSFNDSFTDITLRRGTRTQILSSAVTASDISDARSLRSMPDVDMPAMADEAVAYMLPSLSGSTSLINFGIELKDLKHSNPIPSIRRIMSRRLAIGHLANAGTRKRFIKELVSRLTSAHLNVEFGIVPFVRDIVGMYDDLIDITSRLSRLKRFAGRPQTRHYKRTLPASEGVKSDKEWVTSIRNGTWSTDYVYDEFPILRPLPILYRKARWTRRPTYHATMRYIYSLPLMDSPLEGALARLDVLGVRLDPGIIWDATKFTFLVDWVVDVGGFLHSFGRDNYPIEVRITDFCHSLTGAAQYEVSVSMEDIDLSLMTNPDYERSSPYNPYQWVWTGYSSSYNRVRHEPDIHSVRRRIPKLRQGALAASLFLNKSRRFSSRSYQYKGTLR
jgi:hypothetical protein